MDEMIQTVRSALSPGADDATRQRAAAILRGLLTMLESGGPGGPVGAPPVGARPDADPAPVAAAPRSVDVLGAILDSVRPFLPAHVLAELPRVRIPIVSSKG